MKKIINKNYEQKNGGISPLFLKKIEKHAR